MKNLKSLLLVLWSVFMCATAVNAQNEYSKYINWTLAKSWSNGFKALPEVCTNLKEFYDQYHKNQAQWDAAFKWLAEHDLVNMPAGRHPIEGTQMVASIEDSFNEPLEKRGAESHFHHIDLQYVVKGVERFGLADHESTYASRAYRPDFQAYTYDAKKAVYIDSTPGRFFLFFPCDWHIPKIQTDLESQAIRVVVIKLDYVK